MPSSTHTTRPGRRRWNLPILACLVVLLSLLGAADASSVHRHEVDLVRRQDPLNSGSAAPSTTTTAKGHKTTAPDVQKTTTASSQPASGSGSATSTSAVPSLTALPKVFDSNIGSNFTSSGCASWLVSLQTDTSFTNCLPLSIVIQNSASFLSDELAGQTAQVLDATCNVVFPTCQTLMSTLATQLRTAKCPDDYQSGNPVVVEAYNGFLSYSPMYQAGCLKVPAAEAAAASTESTSEYCYATTVSEDSAPNNSFLYSLPLGSPLPSGPVNCTACLQQTMGIFAQAATNATSPMSKIYGSAATEINAQCGANWVKPNVTVNAATQPSAAAGARGVHWLAWLVVVVVGFAMW